MLWTERLEVRPPSPGLLSGSSGNVGSSPDIQPAPGPWPSPQESHPERDRNILSNVILARDDPIKSFWPPS